LLTAAAFSFTKLASVTSFRVFLVALILFAFAYCLSVPVLAIVTHPVTLADENYPDGCNTIQ
ncbi:hypothetical protein PENTCL1PPCAC_4899, partial [Pristionchus entomophagus]